MDERVELFDYRLERKAKLFHNGILSLEEISTKSH
jgi:hypothetical protein